MDNKTLGIMIDCSRNAVMKPEEIKRFAKLIADMGYNMLQLYTEDTYEIEGEPYFGHMRGRFTRQELKELDEYCGSVGVELVPCIQTLAHLSQLKQWGSYEQMFDCNDILLAGDERVYELIDKMFQTLEECFTSRRVNVGMDEAHFIGRGKYQDMHGFRNRVDILIEHLNRVKEIADRHGFHIMMWSDMFIRMHNNGEYYGENIQIPQETLDKVPEGVELIYWDYYHKDKKNYNDMFDIHKAFNNPIGFAGGLWTWTGYAPNIRFTWDATKAAMESVRENDVNNVFFTMWGDNGKDCSFYTQLPMLYAAAQMAKGNFDRTTIENEFKEKYGYEFEEFFNLEFLNLQEDGESYFLNPCKYLLFNDPFIGLFDFSIMENMSKKFEDIANTINASVNDREYDYLFDALGKLAMALSVKAELGNKTRLAYQAKDMTALKELVDVDYPKALELLESFMKAYRKLWLKENKGFGLEVQEQRFGGLLYRINSCRDRLTDYLEGSVDKIDELEEISIEKYAGCKGDPVLCNDWKIIVTPSVMV